MLPEKKDPFQQGYAELYSPNTSSPKESDPHVAEKIRDEKLKTIGQMCAAMDHWLRTPLAGINAALAILNLEEEALSPDAQRCITDIENKVTAIDSIIQRIKELAKPGEVQSESVDMAQAIENALLLAGYEISTRKIRVEKDIQLQGKSVRGSRIQLEQVLFQLIKNGCEAMGQNGVLSLRAHYAASQKEIVIEVTDTGPGIPKELLRGAMGMFYSTKKVGVGMGLFISNLIIQAHSGSLTVNSDTGQGATFSICLPAL